MKKSYFIRYVSLFFTIIGWGGWILFPFLPNVPLTRIIIGIGIGWMAGVSFAHHTSSMKDLKMLDRLEKMFEEREKERQERLRIPF